MLCVVRQRSLRRADHSSIGVLPTVMSHCVWSRNLKNEATMARGGPQRHRKKSNNVGHPVVIIQGWVWVQGAQGAFSSDYCLVRNYKHIRYRRYFVEKWSCELISLPLLTSVPLLLSLTDFIGTECEGYFVNCQQCDEQPLRFRTKPTILLFVHVIIMGLQTMQW